MGNDIRGPTSGLLHRPMCQICELLSNSYHMGKILMWSHIGKRNAVCKLYRRTETDGSP